MNEQPTDPQDYGDATPDLTADPPGSVGDRMPPISADLEWAQDGRAPAPGEEAEPGVVRVSDRVGADGPAPSSNQGKAEDMPPSPSQGGPGGDGPNSSVGSGITAEPSPATLTGDPGPGTTVPALDSLENGTSAPAMAGAPGGDASQSQSTSRPASAVPGKPDGEVDTRV